MGKFSYFNGWECIIARFLFASLHATREAIINDLVQTSKLYHECSSRGLRCVQLQITQLRFTIALYKHINQTKFFINPH